MRSLSIRTKINALTAFSIILVSALLVGIYFYNQTSRAGEFKQRLLNDSVRSASVIAYTIAPSLIENDFTRMSDLVSYFSNRSDRLHVTIVDNHNRIMADSAGGEIGGTFELPAVSETEKIRDGVVRKYLRDGKESIEVFYPIKAGDLVLGSVIMGLNTSWLRDEAARMHSTAYVYLLAVCAVIILGVVSASAIAGRISEPILLLKEAADRIGRADYDHRVDVSSKDEIGALAAAFNRMTLELKDSRSQLVDKQALIDSQERYRVLFGQSPYGILLIDAEGNISEFNQAAHQDLGYTREEFAQLGIADLDPFENADDVKARSENILRSGRAEFYVKHRTKQGELRDVHVISKTVKLSGIPFLHSMWHDITDIKKMQDRLEEKTAEQNAILENAIAGIAYLKDRRFIWMNSKMEEMFGLSRHEVSGLTTEVLYPSHESYEQFGNAAYPVLADGQTYYTEQLMKRKNGSVFWCSLSGKAIDPSAISKGSIWILQDITERKEAEDRLRQNEAKYRDLFNFSTDGIFIIDFDGNFIDVNNTAYIRLGYTKNELLSLHISKLDHPAFAGRVHERLAQIRDYGSAVFESAHMRKDGTVMPVEVNSRLLNYEGRQVYFSVIRDITERKAAEARIKSALREKEILLKEVHHRVKNNMQVVASMLHLQSGYIKDRESRVVFEESQRRIESLALIHEKLYRSEDLARIDFREYVVDLAGNLLALNTDKAERIKMEVDIEGVVLDVNSSIPCGLIINELVSNALAHAFPNGRKGRIDIRMRNDNERRTVLSVSDNGTGFPEAMDFRNTASLGMQLVTSLVKQLDGVIEMERTEGTSFTIEFQA